MAAGRPPDPARDRNPFSAADMARTLAWFYVAGGVVGLFSLLAPMDPGASLPGLIVNCTIAFVAGLLLFRIGHRLTHRAIAVFLMGGSIMITTAVLFDGHGSSVYSFFYVWVGVEAFYFLNRRLAALQIVFMGACYAVALILTTPDPVGIQRWILTVGIALVTGLLVASMKERILRLVDRLSGAARTDALTGILNRRAFEERFEQELALASRENRSLSVAVGDLDGFKLVNDRLGHQAGDEALRRVARELDKWKRRSDVTARIGGEEFALLLPGTDAEGAAKLADRVRLGIQEVFAADKVPLTISFGIAVCPEHGSGGSALMRASDQALYAAKEMGRNRSVVFTPELAESLGGSRAQVADSTEMQLETVIGLAEALDIRDTGTAKHSRTVARYAKLMALEMGLGEARADRIGLAGMLHDLGKIGISDRVLTKPGPLDEAEWAQMRTHPQIGARLLSRPELGDLRSWILAHHERPDGRGYPFGLAGDAIPLEARILAAADAYEAMTADRVYRRALGEHAAREELIAGSGAQFDAEVVGAFLAALDRQMAAVSPAA
jgi:diguanylate cyclase (GGDEF)-like protein